MIISLLGSFALSSVALAPQQEAPVTSFAVRATEILLGDGTTLEEGVILVAGGEIRAVGRGVELPPGTSLIEHDGVLTAGLVAAHSYSGSSGGLTDSTRAFLPELHAKYAYNSDHSDFQKALAAGVTTILLAAERTNVAGGLTAAVKTSGDRVLSADKHLQLSLHTTSLWGWREPTSWSGAIAHLDQRMSAGEGSFGEVAAGRLPVIVEAWNRHEVARALDFATRHQLKGALRGGSRAGEMVERVVASKLSMIVGPFEVGEDKRHLDSVLALAEAGVPVAFGMQAPENDPVAMRLSAALCVRRGLDSTIAWQGLTRTAADIAGVGNRVGRLERGFDADFVLWSGSPLELTSRVVAVYVDGELAFGGAK
ncbi:MAG: imidazolonepropionase-like amidohydrolase [Planctomycetota bacterium]|jgi:imidazolonepropionase-like amidohydrolase